MPSGMTASLLIGGAVRDRCRPQQINIKAACGERTTGPLIQINSPPSDVQLEWPAPHEVAEFSMKAVSAEQAVAMIPNGASIMIGGFMGVGTPERLVQELVRQKKSELSIICNDAALPGKGVGRLFDASLVSTLTTSHIGLNPNVQKQMMANQVAVNLVPQGTFVERIRAGGFGLGGVLTPTGVGTMVEEGKRQVDVDGKRFLVETALRSDFALIHSFLADYLGNLSYALTARNFNPVMAMAADTVIATAENIVPVGVIAPDHVVTPGPLVDYLVSNG